MQKTLFATATIFLLAALATTTQAYAVGNMTRAHEEHHFFGPAALAHLALGIPRLVGGQHYIILNGQQVVLPGTIACPPGSQPVGDQCVIVAPTIVQVESQTILGEAVTAPSATTSSIVSAPVVTCPSGQLVNGQCVSTTTTAVPPVVTCPTGQLVNGQCVEQQQQIVVGQVCGCPTGSSSINGQCVLSALPSQVTVGTVPGEIIVLGHHYHHEGELPFARH